MAELQQIWARLQAFKQHLPEHYEIRERLIAEYHGLLKEFEKLLGSDPGVLCQFAGRDLHVR